MKKLRPTHILITLTLILSALFLSCSDVVDDDGADNSQNLPSTSTPGEVIGGAPSGYWISVQTEMTGPYAYSEAIDEIEATIYNFTDDSLIQLSYNLIDSTMTTYSSTYSLSSNNDTLTYLATGIPVSMGLSFSGDTLVTDLGYDMMIKYLPYDGPLPPTSWLTPEDDTTTNDTTETDTTQSTLEEQFYGAWYHTDTSIDMTMVLRLDSSASYSVEITVYGTTQEQTGAWEVDSAFLTTTSNDDNSSLKNTYTLSGDTLILADENGNDPLTFTREIAPDTTGNGTTPSEIDTTSIWVSAFETYEYYFEGTLATEETFPYTHDYSDSWMLQFVNDSIMTETGNNSMDETYYVDSMPFFFSDDSTLIVDNELADPITVKFSDDGDTMKVVQSIAGLDDLEVYTLYLVKYTGPMPPSSWASSASTMPVEVRNSSLEKRFIKR